jgi:hypothetical protein
MLENDRDYPPMSVCEVDDEILLYACDTHGYKHTIFTSNDIVIPPKED